ncbi:MAG TPA: trypsin-like serine protease [Kofleriaceae bacterium]|nr:trypsin-like serine protease [Kofleriaceae bacterium]
MARWVLGIVLLVGCAREPVARERRAVVDGSETAGDPAVVALVHRRTGCEELPTVLCTGTLIAPRVVLTAAHCTEDLRRGAQLEVYAGADTAAAGALRLVTDWADHPNWDGQDHDLAVVRLDSAFDGIAPAALARTPLDASVIGRTVRIVGFGLSDAAQDRPDGKKRHGTMQVTELATTTFTATPAPAVSCQGDSGGPVFDGESLIGVTASGDSGCAATAIATRVDPYLQFIDDYVTAVGGLSDDTPDGVIAIEAICGADCAGDADCPAGLTCTEHGTEQRCTSLGAIPGAFGAACTGDDQCGDDPCGRVWPHGPDACRCLAPCDDGGCRATSPSGQAWLLLLAMALLLVRRRHR